MNLMKAGLGVKMQSAWGKTAVLQRLLLQTNHFADVEIPKE